jgi:adenylate cyclase
MDRALDAAKRAVALDPTSQLAHQALAGVYFHRHEIDAFFAEAERAIAINPNHAMMLAVFGLRFTFAGDHRGTALIEKAKKLDPFLPTVFNFPVAMAHFDKGEYEQALVATREVSIPDFFRTHVYLAAIYAELGRESDAHSARDEVLRLYPDFTVEEYVSEMLNWNFRDELIRRVVAALRKAGLPE